MYQLLEDFASEHQLLVCLCRDAWITLGLRGLAMVQSDVMTNKRFAPYPDKNDETLAQQTRTVASTVNSFRLMSSVSKRLDPHVHTSHSRRFKKGADAFRLRLKGPLLQLSIA